MNATIRSGIYLKRSSYQFLKLSTTDLQRYRPHLARTPTMRRARKLDVYDDSNGVD